MSINFLHHMACSVHRMLHPSTYGDDYRPSPPRYSWMAKSNQIHSPRSIPCSSGIRVLLIREPLMPAPRMFHRARHAPRTVPIPRVNMLPSNESLFNATTQKFNHGTGESGTICPRIRKSSRHILSTQKAKHNAKPKQEIKYITPPPSY